MIDRNLIREHMDVVASDGAHVGRVDKIEGERLKLERGDSADHQHHHVPMEWVSRVDDKVHLTRDHAAVTALGTAEADGTAHRGGLAGIGGLSGRGLLWPLLGLLALILLVVALTQGHRNRGTAVADQGVVIPTVPGAPLQQGTLAYDLDRFLAGNDGTPRTFTLDTVDFNPGTADIRGIEQAGLDDVARVFAAYPNARAAVVGYTDSVGPAVANSELGADRARSVIAALEARGIPGKRFEARTGGEAAPVAANPTPNGQFENRRSELVILKR